MNHAKIEFEMAPRTQRFLRELGGTDRQEDPEVRYWKRVSAVVCVSAMASLIALLAIAGTHAPSTPGLSAAPAEASAAPVDADVL